MNPEQQRIKIAEACGAKWMNLWCASHATLTFHDEGENASLPDWTFCQKDKITPFDRTIPDYLNDLNAMHEAEKVFADDDLFRGYEAQLDKVVPMSERWIFATAAQRAEAFLRTLNLWEE